MSRCAGCSGHSVSFAFGRVPWPEGDRQTLRSRPYSDRIRVTSEIEVGDDRHAIAIISWYLIGLPRSNGNGLKIGKA